MQTVANILDSKQKTFNFVSPDSLVLDALNVLTAVNLSYLVVMDGEEYKGLFGEREYTRNVILKGRASNSTTVKEVMTTDLPIVGLTDTVEYCMNIMNMHKTRYLLAYDDQQFRGVITIHDLLRQVIANKELVFDHAVANSLIDSEESGRVF